MRKRLFLAGTLLFGLFVFFSYLVHKDFFTQFDFNATVRLQDNISRRFDPYFSVLSDIGTFEVMLGLLVIILFLLRKIGGVAAFALFGVFHLIELYGKSFVSHLPPPEFFLRTEHLIDFPQFHIRSVNSYPSGHAGRAAFLTLFIGLIVLRSKKFSRVQKTLIIGVLVTYDIVMMVSRIYLGEHWASDVIGGSILGISMAVLSVIFI